MSSTRVQDADPGYRLLNLKKIKKNIWHIVTGLSYAMCTAWFASALGRVAALPDETTEEERSLRWVRSLLNRR